MAYNSNTLNGRSSSQVSVYNYPEHLNPFYQDENHKRLRFWKVSSSNKKNPNGSRRGSFNFGSIKDLLPLKTFRLRKRSSELGINKTSESPPPLRKEYDQYNSEDESKYSTYDPHFRHTTNVGLNDAFQRNSAYRTSLQDMNRKDNDVPFIRNNRYRSTMQNGSSHQVSPMQENNRYIYAGSITPTPKSRYITNKGMTPGCSMNSISTNPFDDDENADSITIASNMEYSPGQRLYKKKRRAPQPPTPTVVPKISDEENIELRIEENNETKESQAEFSRLTADFESFMKSSENVEKKDDSKDVKEKESSCCIQRIETVEIHRNQDDPVRIEENVEVQEIKLKKQLEPEEVHQITIESTKSPSREETPDYIPMTVREKFHTLRIEEKEVKQQEQVSDKVVEIRKSPVRTVIDTETVVTKHVPDKNINEDLVVVEKVETPIRSFTDNTSIVTKTSPTKELFERDCAAKTSDEVVEVNEVFIRKEAPRRAVEQRRQSCSEEAREEAINMLSEIMNRRETPIKKHVEVNMASRFDPELEEVNEVFIRKEAPARYPSKIVKQAVIDDDEPNVLREILDLEIKEEKTPLLDSKPASFPRESIVYAQKEEPLLKETVSIQERTVHRTIIEPSFRTSQESKDAYFRQDSIETPVEVESKLFSQGFTKVDKPLKMDEEEDFIRQKDEDDDISDSEDLPPKLPERRRSVREIIESINRSQSLLKMNQPATPRMERKSFSQKYNYLDNSPFPSPATKPAPPSKENVIIKLQKLSDSEKKINDLITDLEDYSNENSQQINDVEESRKSYYDNIPEIIQGAIDESNNNNEALFEKCIIKNDRNNNNTDNEVSVRISRGEINPVPKPRRSRIFENGQQ